MVFIENMDINFREIIENADRGIKIIKICYYCGDSVGCLVR